MISSLMNLAVAILGPIAVVAGMRYLIDLASHLTIIAK